MAVSGVGDVGAPLFERERHGMVLTDAGRSLLGYARRAMLELDRARAEITGAAGGHGIGGLVTLGLLPSTIDTLASPLVTTLAAHYPGIRVRLAMGYAGTLLRWLQSGEIDAALLYGAERSPDIQTAPLIEEPLWVIGPKGADLRPERPVPLATLAGQPLVLPSTPHGIRTLVDHACAVAGVTLSITVETNALSVQRSLVLGGHGLTRAGLADEPAGQRGGALCRRSSSSKRAVTPSIAGASRCSRVCRVTAKRSGSSSASSSEHWMPVSAMKSSCPTASRTTPGADATSASVAQPATLSISGIPASHARSSRPRSPVSALRRTTSGMA